MRTVWWAIAMDGYDVKQLGPEQREVAVRIMVEGLDGAGRKDWLER